MYGWCGNTDAHINGGVDCTGFGFEPVVAEPVEIEPVEIEPIISADELKCANYLKDSGKDHGGSLEHVNE